MKSLAVFILLFFFSLSAFSQAPKPKSKGFKKPATATQKLGNEKEELEKAVAVADLAERIKALQKFNKDFPKSNEKTRALELIVSARAALADEKLQAGDTAASVELFKLAVKDAPKPVSDKLFTDVVLQIPSNLFFRGERAAAVETAQLIEEKAEGNAKQILGLATFYLNLENASEAKRLADKAIELDATLPAAYQTLGLANRLNFQLDDAAAAYQKALELDANSSISKRSLAEMKRAIGKPAEAVALYREILAKDETDNSARTGLALALFDAENKAEAESEMQKSLETNPNNLFLLVGAAYWYAAHNEAAKASDLAQKAVALEPRYTWAHIALARAFVLQNRPLDAEKALLNAQRYGNFPTLDYEIAAARFQAGFYREAAEGLQKTFAVKDNLIETKLGGRVSKEAKNFVELLSLERRASIFEPTAANNSETADQMKSLLDFYQKLESSAPNDESIVAQAADEFVRGDDKMKVHRQLFVANRLLDKRVNLPKVLELTKAAVGGVNNALDVPNPAATVLADELYESRKLAIARGELIIVPEVPRQTLSNVLRGRIEDISGWALFQENKPDEAVTRLKRAISVLPEKSSWWKASMWRLGAALESAGKSSEALEAYVKSYANSDADAVKYSVVEALYQKVNGNLEGLEAKIGAKPDSITSNFPAKSETTVQTTEKNEKEIPTLPAAEITPPVKTEASPTPNVVTETPQTDAETKPTPELPANQPTPKIENAPTPEKKADEAAPIEIKNELKTGETEKKPTSENPTKSLFEPIVINVPKPVTKTSEAIQEKKPTVENPENSRPRIAVEKEAEQTAPCKITSSEEAISVLNGGGSLSVLVSFEGDGDLKEIKAVSSSPNDVEIVVQPFLDGDSKRGVFFVVKSISRKTGEYTVTFESACGKKEVPVKVR
jgi:tetratricopeptide (TPR) repeat protein/ribosomal protein S15P/S13E